MDKLKIVAADDERLVLTALGRMVDQEDFDLILADDDEGVRDAVAAHDPFLVMLDLYLGDAFGLDLLAELKEAAPERIVMMMTGVPTIEAAVSAMQMGAFDFLRKPFDRKELRVRINRARDHYMLVNENLQLKVEIDGLHGRSRIIGESKGIVQIIETIGVMAATPASVLVTGESGTGKELVAREIHHRSDRAECPFVPVDCVAMPDQLISSELFGHEKGAFTGATEQRRGLFEIAEGGTIFLDEITELGPEVQAKLLRVLQERQFRRVGGRDLIDVDVRVISATNRNPEQAVKDDRFRLDLYYRLNVIPVHLPPLRERTEDIPLLTAHFLAEFAAESGHELKNLAPDAFEQLAKHAWPGNIRELRNVLQRLSIMSPGSTITGEQVRGALAQAKILAAAEPDQELYELPFKEAKRQWVQRFERDYITRMLDKHKGVIVHAAEQAEIDRKTMSRLIAELGI